MGQMQPEKTGPASSPVKGPTRIRCPRTPSELAAWSTARVFSMLAFTLRGGSNRDFIQFGPLHCWMRRGRGCGKPVPVPGDRLLPKCRDDSAPAADTKKLSQQLPLTEVGRQLAGTNVFQKDHDRRRRCSRECKEPGMDGKIRSPDDWVWL